MAATINGLNAAVKNRESFSFTPNIGGEWGGRYEGPRDAVFAKMADLIAAGYTVNFECDQSPIASVTFKTQSDKDGNQPSNPNADYIDNWQVLRNTCQKELLMSDHTLIASIDATNLHQLKQMIENPKDVAYLGQSPTSDVLSNPGSASYNAALYLFSLWMSGQRSIEVKQPVIRVTRVTNPKYDAPFDLSNVDKILSTARAITDSGIPSNYAIPITSLATAFVARTPQSGGFALRNDVLKLAFGWLKDAVTSETVGRTKNQYVLEYKFGLWDTKIYGLPIA